MLESNLLYPFVSDNGNKYLYDAFSNYIYYLGDRKPAKDIPVFNNNILLTDNKYINNMFTVLTKRNILNKNVIRQFNKREFGYAEFPIKEEYLKCHSNLSQLTLELTQQCNLRCKYCIYKNDFQKARNYSSQVMNWNVAKKSIDYFIEKLNSPLRTTKVSRKYKAPLSFYGGEPLLNFDLICKCVDYIKKLHLIDRIYFNMTTNATLINKEIASFLINNDFTLLISLDGSKNENDRNRIYKNGLGTFNNIWKGLENIRKINMNYYLNKISFNSVYTMDTNILKVFEYYSKLRNKCDYKMGVRFSFDATEIKNSNCTEDNYFKRMKNISVYYYDLLKEKHITNHKMSILYLLNIFYGRKYYNIYTRGYSDPKKIALRSAICTPGENRLFVDTYGKFHMCERISHEFSLGDCWNGIDYNKIIKIFNNYKSAILYDCDKCIAMNVCKICYATVANNDGEFKKSDFCDSAKHSIRKLLIEYTNIMEKNSDAIFRTNSTKNMKS